MRTCPKSYHTLNVNKLSKKQTPTLNCHGSATPQTHRYVICTQHLDKIRIPHTYIFFKSTITCPGVV